MVELINWKNRCEESVAKQHEEDIRRIRKVADEFARSGKRRSQNYNDGFMDCIKLCLEELRKDESW